VLFYCYHSFHSVSEFAADVEEPLVPFFFHLLLKYFKVFIVTLPLCQYLMFLLVEVLLDSFFLKIIFSVRAAFRDLHACILWFCPKLELHLPDLPWLLMTEFLW